MKYENLEGRQLQLLIHTHTLEQLELHPWLSERLIEDYEITVDNLCYESNGTERWLCLYIPLVFIKPNKLHSVIDCSSPNSYPQTKKDSKFRILDKTLA